MIDGVQSVLSEYSADQPFTWSSFRDLLYSKHSSGSSRQRSCTIELICQPQLAAFQLFLQNPVLLDQVRDHVLLVAVHSARYREEQHLQWVRIGSHWLSLSTRNPIL